MPACPACFISSLPPASFIHNIVIHNIVKPYTGTYICNLSLKTGIFPDYLKIAKVLPFYKSGLLNEVSNYRPVYFTPII